MIDLELLKEKNPIDEVITELTGFVLKGRDWKQPQKGTGEGGLFMNVRSGTFSWSSRVWKGDVIEFVMKYKELEFVEALRWLADRVNMPYEMSAAEKGRLAARRKRESILDLAVTWFEGQLGLLQRGDAEGAEVSNGLAYARSRGWTDETIKGMRLGYWDGRSYEKLRGWFELNGADLMDPIAVNLIGFKGDVLKWFQNRLPSAKPQAEWVEKGRIPGILFNTELLIYPHIEMGRVQYLAGRNLGEDGPKSWNLRSDFVGARRPMWNEFVYRQKKQIVVVEGQADLVTAFQWQQPAVALAGCSADDELVERLKEYKNIFLALDGDEAGQSGIGKLSQRLEMQAQIIQMPVDEDGKGQDLNDLLLQGETRSDFIRRRSEAAIFALWAIERAAVAPDLDRDEQIERAVAEFAKLSKKRRARLVKPAAKALGWNIGELKETLKAIDKEIEDDNPTTATKPIKRSVGGNIDGIVFELIVDEENKRTAFATSQLGEDGKVTIKTVRELEFDHVHILPYDYHHPVVTGGYMYYPSNPEPYGSTKDLIQVIRSHLYAYVDVPDEVEEFAAVYALLTWLADKLPVVPYLRALGDTGGGKTRFIQSVGAVSFRPAFLSGAGSPASFYRLIDMFGMITLVVDEMDVARGDETSEMVNIFNTGNRRSGAFGIPKVDKVGDELVPVVYKTYGPKMVSMREEFIDKATNSRFWTWETGYTSTRDDIPTFLLEDSENKGVAQFWGSALKVRNMCLMYRLHNVHRDLDFDESRIDRRLPGRFREMIYGAVAAFPDLKEMLEQMAMRKLEQTVLDYQQTPEAKVIYAIMRQQFRPIIHKKMTDDHRKRNLDEEIAIENRLSMQAIADEVNRLIDIENNVSPNDEDSRLKYQKQYQYGGRRISTIVRVKLNIPVERARRGSRPTVAVWDNKRMSGLVTRYGLEDQLLSIMAGEADYYDIDSKDQRDFSNLAGV